MPINFTDSKGSETAVEKHFDQRATTYSQLFNPATRTGAAFGFLKRRDHVVATATGRGGSLLDCASGTGEITNSVIQAGAFSRVHINDISIEMLNRATALVGRNSSLTTSCTDIFKINEQVEGLKFDMILCLGLIAHTGRLSELLQVLAKALCESGIIVLQTSLLDHFGTRIVQTASCAIHEKRNGYRQTFYSLADIQVAATNVGLRVQAVQRFGLGIPFGDRISPRLNYLLEKNFQGLSKKYGAEAILIISHTKNASPSV